MGIEIKTKWDLRTFMFAITENGVRACMPFEIIIRQTLLGNYIIFYNLKDVDKDSTYNGCTYIVQEKYTALNPDCLNEMIANGEYNED